MTRKESVPRGAVHWEARITHCTQGHPYDEANTAHYRGRRFCVQCRKDRGGGSGKVGYVRRKRLAPGERKALIDKQSSPEKQRTG